MTSTASAAGYTPEGWRTVVRMMQNVDAPVPKDQWDTVTEYLIKSFPERRGPPPSSSTGRRRPAIKLWPVPTPGSRPHDPLAAKDGSIWYTGQLANKLGRLDPKTGAVQGISRSRRRTPARTAWSRTRTATSGSPATAPA